MTSKNLNANSSSSKLENVSNKAKNIIPLFALALSTITFIWPYISKTMINPSINVSFPDEIQFECTHTKLNQDVCNEESSVKLIADLFSIWNNSNFSMKPEILKEIYAVVYTSGDLSKRKQIFKWKYFTEISDVEQKKLNTGRLLFSHNSLQNVEIEFYPLYQSNTYDTILYDKNRKICKEEINFASTNDPYTWKNIKNSLVTNSLIINFCLDFDHSPDKYLQCEMKVEGSLKNRLRKNTLVENYIINSVKCNDLTNTFV